MTFDPAAIKTKVFGLLYRKRSADVGPSGIADPIRDWKLVLLCASVLVLLSGVWSFFSYAGLVGSTDALEEPIVHKPKLDREALAEMLAALERRQDAHERARTESARFVDPGR